jgi:hypothetical protein
MPTMHCPNCGQQLSSDLKFCRSCGMKLDSVVKAVNEHLSLDGSEPPAKNSDRTRLNRMARGMLIGVFVVVIGALTTSLGKGVWAFEKVGVFLAFVGLMLMFYSVISPMLGPGGITGRVKKKKLAEPETQLNLNSADSFEPVSSVTEGTTRDLAKDPDGNKTKVLR